MMEYVVAKAFLTSQRRFGVGDRVFTEELDGRADGLLAEGFINDPAAKPVAAPRMRLKEAPED